MFRRMVQILCWLSLLLSIAFALLWWRSYYRWDTWTTPRIREGFGINSADGGLRVNVRWTNPSKVGPGSGFSSVPPWYPDVHNWTGPGDPMTQVYWAVNASHGAFIWQNVHVPYTHFGPNLVPAADILRIVFPHWSAVAFFGLFPAIYLPILVRRWIIRRRLARLGLCRRCGYDLRASADRCPECGQAFTRPMESTEPILPRA